MGNNGSIIKLKNLTKDFSGTVVVSDVSLDIKRGEFVTLLGPSGCGKTTTLRMIAGFERPSSGEVLFNGENIEKLPPYKRNVNTVFQRYALFPHLNVAGNVAFGLKLKRIPKTTPDNRKIFSMQTLSGKVKNVPHAELSISPTKTVTVKMPKSEINEKVKRALKIVGLSDYEKREVGTLSGGQQQRVAIARAIVNEPDVLLLDEPLGALDLKMRQEMQLELKQMHKKLGITFIYVTHDQEEALTMSDTIVVMKNGVIYQVGSPTEIYNEPKNAFVADFIGESNIFDGIMTASKKVSFCGELFSCVDEGFEYGKPIDVVVRPEDWILTPFDKGQINGEITSSIFKGVHYEMTLKANGFEFLIHSTKECKPGDKIGLSVDPFDIHIMHKERLNNEFEVEFISNTELSVQKAKYKFDISVLFPNYKYNNETDSLTSPDGSPIELSGKRARVAVEFTGIDLADDEKEAPMAGNVNSMVYKGKNYLVSVVMEDGTHIIADTKYLWDDGDRVGILIEPKNFSFLGFIEDEKSE